MALLDDVVNGGNLATESEKAIEPMVSQLQQLGITAVAQDRYSARYGFRSGTPSATLRQAD